jgi:hypothetical protein
VTITTSIARLSALPRRHRLVAGGLAVFIPLASLCVALLLPVTYKSSALVAFHSTEPAADRQPLAQASSLLEEILRSPSNSIGDQQQDPLQASAPDLIRHQLAISQIDPSTLRITATASSSQHAQSLAQAVADQLISRQRIDPEQATAEAKPDSLAAAASQTEKTFDPASAREEALLRVTIAVLDARIAESRGRLQQSHPRSLETDLGRLQNQRAILLKRLRETLQAGSTPVKAFTLRQRATQGRQISAFRSQIVIGGILAGALLSLFYIAIALWHFRPISSPAALESLLSREILLVGTIGEFQR